MIRFLRKIQRRSVSTPALTLNNTGVMLNSVDTSDNTGYSNNDNPQLCSAPKESPKYSSKFLSFPIKKKLIFPINILAKCISIKSIRPVDRISFTSSTKHFFKYQKNLRLDLDQRRTINQNNAYISDIKKCIFVEI